MDARKKGAHKQWTVIGYFADNLQPWLEWVVAATAEEAARLGIRNIMKCNQWAGSDTEAKGTVHVVEVFRGKHHGHLTNDCILDGHLEEVKA